MIVRLTGIVCDVTDDRAVVERDGLAYEVLLCGHTIAELSERTGQTVTLTTLHYLEGSSVGGNLTPRLIGFLRTEDKAFFERFITVKNIGPRKALRALDEPVSRIAAAIETGDTAYLSKRPGVGKRAAEQIVAELRGKVGDFAIGAPEHDEPVPTTDSWTAAQRDALEVMLALGERRPEAQRWIEKAVAVNPGERGADDWVRLAYRIKSSEG